MARCAQLPERDDFPLMVMALRPRVRARSRRDLARRQDFVNGNFPVFVRTLKEISNKLACRFRRTGRGDDRLP